MSNMETSREALESIEPQITNITDRVYRHILSKGEQGITDDEGFRALGMNPNTYRPCRINLMDKGLVLNTNTKGITDSGRKAWRWKAVQASEAVPPFRVKKRQRKTLPTIDPLPLPEGYDISLKDARGRMLAKLNEADSCRCPCCGVSVTK
jgi:hypothetical protein